MRRTALARTNTPDGSGEIKRVCVGDLFSRAQGICSQTTLRLVCPPFDLPVPHVVVPQIMIPKILVILREVARMGRGEGTPMSIRGDHRQPLRTKGQGVSLCSSPFNAPLHPCQSNGGMPSGIPHCARAQGGGMSKDPHPPPAPTSLIRWAGLSQTGSRATSRGRGGGGEGRGTWAKQLGANGSPGAGRGEG